jgi:sigma-B regulation protein RsbU (phosphoserine phosphatase)
MTTTSVRTGHPPPPANSSDAQSFICAEVWGGNRPINTAINLAGVRGQVYSQPCDGGRGGDVHYVSICGSGLTSRFCLADVAGHGEKVARVSDELHNLLVRFMNDADQRRVLSALNGRLSKRDDQVLTTAVTATYFPPFRRLSISYAGHPPGWIYRVHDERWSRLMLPSAALRTKELVDLPLAVEPATVFTRRNVRVRPGDRLVVVTDGVLEAPAPNGELFGEERLQALLEHSRATPIEDLPSEILAAVMAHTQTDTLRHDDVTMMALEIVPGPKGLGVWHMLKTQWQHRRHRKSRRSGADST